MFISEIWHADTKYLHERVLKIINCYDVLYSDLNFSHGFAYFITQISKNSVVIAKRANTSS